MTTAREFRAATFSNPAILKAGSHAAGVWMLAGCWARSNRTGGVVPREALPQIAPDLASTPDAMAALVGRLVGAGLLEACAEGWQIRYVELLGKPRVLSTKTPQELSLIRAENGRKGAAKRWAHKHAGASMPTVAAVPAPKAIPKIDSKLPSAEPFCHSEARPPYRSQITDPDLEDQRAGRSQPESETEHKHETGEAEVDEAAVLTLSAGSAQDRVADEIRRVRRCRSIPKPMLGRYAAAWVASAEAAGVAALPLVSAAVDLLALKLASAPGMDGGRAIKYLNAVVLDLVGKASQPATAPPSSRPSAPSSARHPSRRQKAASEPAEHRETPAEKAQALLEMAEQGDRILRERREAARKADELRKCAPAAEGLYSMADIYANGGNLPPRRQAVR